MTTTLRIGLLPGPKWKPAGWPQAPNGVDARPSGRTPPLLPSPLSPHGVEGFDGGLRKRGYFTSSGSTSVRNAPYLAREREASARSSTPRRLTHRANGWTSGPNSACAAYTCESGFSLLYETRGPSPTLVHGGKGQGTPYHGAKSDKCGPCPHSPPLIKLGYAEVVSGLGS